MRNVALFFGSFNPIHHGHLIIANYIAEYENVDEVCFIVSPQNPLKQSHNLIVDSKRLLWVKQSIEGYKKFSVSDIEFYLDKPSYTYQTLSILKEKNPNNNYILIMGADNLDLLKKWKNYQWIIDNFKIFIYPRLGYSNSIPEEWRNNMKFVNAPTIEISATNIRNATIEGKDVRFFVPQKIYFDFIATINTK